ncbi:hypothetical protein HY989_03735 [Candidatus Micrarchaeota archaeon]|nr:hypothetical protein [Candidatus Micrarchaeota archaeon]
MGIKEIIINILAIIGIIGISYWITFFIGGLILPTFLFRIDAIIFPLFLISMAIGIALIATNVLNETIKKYLKYGLAIFGILFIIEIIFIFLPLGCTYGDCGEKINPSYYISQDLKKVQTKGYGIEVPRKLTFEKSTIFIKALIRTIPILEDEVKFVCEDATICGSGKALEINENSQSLQINQKIELYSAVCGDLSRNNGAKYCIAFASTEQKASDDCDKACLA